MDEHTVDTPEFLRLKAGYEVPEVAERSGVSAANIRRIEHGQIHNLRPITLRAIVLALDSVEYDEYLRAAMRVRDAHERRPHEQAEVPSASR